jgi:hydrogenase expression/formation protein HypD
VYGIEDALLLAEKYKDKEVVFMAVGFETTAPTTASVLLRGLPSNFSVLCCHRLIPPALQAILDMGEIKIDGFIEPGHVSTIIGVKPYEFISKNYHIPQVITGFEPIDLLMGAWMLVRQIQQEKAEVENEYTRAVKSEGNRKAQQIMKQVFEPVDIKWRGFPMIPQSGLMLRNKYASYDARKKYEAELSELTQKEFIEPVGCLCGDVLRGLISSKECPLFGRQCAPDNPVGPCMVSSEGNCNIQYRYSKK